MSSEFEGFIGYIKYRGDLVAAGLMEARKAANALNGIDAAVRYFSAQQAQVLRDVDYELPILVRRGSWEALIPTDVDIWVKASLGVVATAYLTQAAQKMAERDFQDFGFKDIFKKSIEAIKWVIRIGKHMKDLSIRRFEGSRFEGNNELIGIRNSNGDYLYVPKEYFDLYVNCSQRIIEKLVTAVEEGRELVVGTVENGQCSEEVVTASDRSIFVMEEYASQEDFLFPELVHGDVVVLDGEVTRENKTSNSMGFKYMGHVLTSYPESGNIVPYKEILFLRCRIFATVSRLDENGRIAARRPKLYFTHIEPLEDDPRPSTLFD